MPFCCIKRPVLCCNTARFAGPNGTFGNYNKIDLQCVDYQWETSIGLFRALDAVLLKWFTSFNIPCCTASQSVESVPEKVGTVVLYAEPRFDAVSASRFPLIIPSRLLGNRGVILLLIPGFPSALVLL